MPFPEPPYQVLVLGDVRGHAFLLRRAVRDLGGNPATGELPPDVVVIQVGNLLGPGPDPAGCVALAQRMLEGSGGCWLQLWGDHEAQMLGGPTLPGRDGALQDSRLTRWRTLGAARMAVAVDTPEYGAVLVTHAGLTRHKWEAIGSPDDPGTAAAMLDAELHDAPAAALAAGEMAGMKPRAAVGVAWASPAELLSSWDLEELPFSQVYGHASPRHWHRGRWQSQLPDRVRTLGYYDDASHHTDFSWPGGGHLVCVDAAYGRDEATVPLAPLVLTGEVLGL